MSHKSLLTYFRHANLDHSKPREASSQDGKQKCKNWINIGRCGGGGDGVNYRHEATQIYV